MMKIIAIIMAVIMALTAPALAKKPKKAAGGGSGIGTVAQHEPACGIGEAAYHEPDCGIGEAAQHGY